MRGFKGFAINSIFLLVLTMGTRTDSAESFALDNVCIKNRQRMMSSQHPQRYPRRYRKKIVSITRPPTRKIQLFSSENDDSSIRYLGKGPNAIVRPGVVLLAPAEEFHHYLRQSAVFIHAMGMDENDEYVIRGVILDNPTPFTIGEMMESKSSGGLYENLIFRGGESGGQEAFCLHSVDALGLEEIGASNIYQGGELDKIQDPSKVKFFFNYMEFLEQELEDMFEIIHEDGDAWTSVEVPPEIVLDSSYDKGEAWSRLRNSSREKRNEMPNAME